MADPKFVRLPERLLGGNVTDIASGWGISGLDVKEFPEDPEEQAFVRQALRAQLLEEASSSAHSRIQKANQRIEDLISSQHQLRSSFPSDAVTTPVPWNEAAVAKVAKKERAAILQARFSDEADEGEPEETPEDPYAGMTKEELQGEANSRNLPTNGTKDEILNRLREDDKQKQNA